MSLTRKRNWPHLKFRIYASNINSLSYTLLLIYYFSWSNDLVFFDSWNIKDLCMKNRIREFHFPFFSYQTPPSSTDNEVRIVFECFRKKYRTAIAFSGLLCATLDIFAHFWARAFDNCAMKIIYLARGTLNTASKSFFLKNCKIKMFLYHESITVPQSDFDFLFS